MADSRRAAERWGQGAETLALWWLRLKGYRLVARRYRCPVGEIDLVMRRGRCLVFVEVKARREAAQGLAALGRSQRRRIAAAAQAFHAAHPQLAALDSRFDLITMARGRLPRHLRAAWRADDP